MKKCKILIRILWGLSILSIISSIILFISLEWVAALSCLIEGIFTSIIAGAFGEIRNSLEDTQYDLYRMLKKNRLL